MLGAVVKRNIEKEGWLNGKIGKVTFWVSLDPAFRCTIITLIGLFAS